MDYHRVAQLVANSVLGDRYARLLTHEDICTPSYVVYRFEFLSKGNQKELFVKLPPDNDLKFQITAKRLRTEFDITQRVKSSFPSTPEMDTVSPAGFIDEINAMVTWGIRGRSLQSQISSQLRLGILRDKPRLERLSGLAAQWLRDFHASNLSVDRNQLRPLVSTFCEDRLEVLLQTKNSQITENLAETIKTNIDRWLEDSLANTETKVVLCHNDFSPHNILVTETGICVLDFSFSTAGFMAFDLACFWHKLEDLKRSAFRRNKAIEALQYRFLETYGSGFDFSGPEMKLGLSRLVLSIMLTLLNARSTRIHEWAENRRRYAHYLALLKAGFEPFKQ